MRRSGPSRDAGLPDPKLRQLAETDEYVYVGGYLVHFCPESVRLENGKYRLTSTAQMNIAKSCIGFTPVHSGYLKKKGIKPLSMPNTK